MSRSLAAIALAAIAASPSSASADVGVMIDAGLPDGVIGSIVYRATPRLRLHAGAGTNLIGPGVRAGVGLSAFPFWITPSINVEAGRYFAGDANRLVRLVTGGDSDEPALREVGYDFASAHLGLELGYARATFYIHAGMSAVQGTVRGLQQMIDDSRGDDMSGSDVEIRQDPTVRIAAPSARTGLVVYF